MSMNKVILQGRLCAAPELRQSKSGKSVLSVNVAVDRRGEGCDFITVNAWDKTAEFIAKYFTKGKEILLCGRIETRSYEVNGTKRPVTEVVAEEVAFCGSKDNAKSEQHTIAESYKNAEPKFEEIENNDNLPF